MLVSVPNRNGYACDSCDVWPRPRCARATNSMRRLIRAAVVCVRDKRDCGDERCLWLYSRFTNVLES